MTIKQQLIEDMKVAMKARDASRLETIRYLISLIKNLEIDEGDVDESMVISLLQKEVKKRRESIEQFINGDRQDLATAEEAKVQIVAAYLPSMLNEEELKKIINDINDGEKDFGKLMSLVMQQVRGRADGSLVSRMVREFLTQ